MKTATLFALVTLLPALAAQEPGQGQPFVLAAGEVKVTDFVDRCAKYLDWNILYDQRELSSCPMAEVRTQNAISVDRDGCIELLSTMLVRGGLALTELDAPKHVYEILSMSGPRNREIMTRAVRREPDAILAQPTLRMPVTTVLELKHTNATFAVNSLRPFFASAGGQSFLTVGNLGNAGSILLSGMQDQVATAISMVRAGDVPPAAGTTMDLEQRLSSIEQRLAAIETKLGLSGAKSEEK
jgi:hypothetical protein